MSYSKRPKVITHTNMDDSKDGKAMQEIDPNRYSCPGQTYTKCHKRRKCMIICWTTAAIPKCAVQNKFQFRTKWHSESWLLCGTLNSRIGYFELEGMFPVFWFCRRFCRKMFILAEKWIVGFLKWIGLYILNFRVIQSISFL